MDGGWVIAGWCGPWAPGPRALQLCRRAAPPAARARAAAASASTPARSETLRNPPEPQGLLEREHPCARVCAHSQAAGLQCLPAGAGQPAARRGARLGRLRRRHLHARRRQRGAPGAAARWAAGALWGCPPRRAAAARWAAGALCRRLRDASSALGCGRACRRLRGASSATSCGRAAAALGHATTRARLPRLTAPPRPAPPLLQYFAVGAAAWFEAIARADINGRIVSRARMGIKDPGLAALMRYAFGRVSWGWRQVCLDCRLWPPVRNITAITTAAVAAGAVDEELGGCDPAGALPCGDRSGKCAFWAEAGECDKVGACSSPSVCAAYCWLTAVRMCGGRSSQLGRAGQIMSRALPTCSRCSAWLGKRALLPRQAAGRR
jgi:hypothetical protein